MNRLDKLAGYFRWLRPGARRSADVAAAPSPESSQADVAAAAKLCGVLESILLWESSVNSISVVLVFNILFWGIVVLEVRGFAAASSAALVVVLCYSSLEAQRDESPRPATSRAKAEQLDRMGKQLRNLLENLGRLRRDQPGAFCSVVCALSLGLWIVGRAVNGVLLAYAVCMSVLVGPALLLKLPGRVLPSKEWDSEIEDFLPAVTEDNLQVLTRAGESGDHSPTPTSMSSDLQNDPFNEEELLSLRMPSHEEGSTDGVELSEPELSPGDTDIDGIRFQSGHFEKGSSSEEEAELGPRLPRNAVPSHSDDSDSDFEVIDSREVAAIREP